MRRKIWAILTFLLPCMAAVAQTVDSTACETSAIPPEQIEATDTIFEAADTVFDAEIIEVADTSAYSSTNASDTFADLLTQEPLYGELGWKYCDPKNPYSQPYSFATSIEHPDWNRLWVNTAVLSGAFVGTLLVLECLPEDATSWNRAALQDVPLFKRWYNHVIKDGPEWDHDKLVFNYVLHPYAGAVYFMAARSCGFNFYRSMLYSACISTIGWEFGIEAFMERPSYQDIFITPIVGSLIGEGFYRLKRHIADNGYQLAGSRFLGGFVAFLIDPVNEVIGLFKGNPARQYGNYRASIQGSMQPWVAAGTTGFTVSIVF